jgi:hypothetical protein
MDEYSAWEAAHPNTSSFNYVAGDGYPYTYAIVPTMLEEAEYDSQIDLDVGVSCYKLMKETQSIYSPKPGRGVLRISCQSEFQRGFPHEKSKV